MKNNKLDKEIDINLIKSSKTARRLLSIYSVCIKSTIESSKKYYKEEK